MCGLFQVHESKVAIEEGLLPERINGLDKAIAGDDLWKWSVCAMMLQGFRVHPDGPDQNKAFNYCVPWMASEGSDEDIQPAHTVTPPLLTSSLWLPLWLLAAHSSALRAFSVTAKNKQLPWLKKCRLRLLASSVKGSMLKYAAMIRLFKWMWKRRKRQEKQVESVIDNSRYVEIFINAEEKRSWNTGFIFFKFGLFERVKTSEPNSFNCYSDKKGIAKLPELTYRPAWPREMKSTFSA